MRSSLVLLPFFVALASAVPNAEKRQNCGTYTVPNVTGGFRTRQFIDFSTARAGQDSRQVLSNNGFYISDWDVTEQPPLVTRTFTPNNVRLVNGALSLDVTAYPGTGKILSAEIGTNTRFLYGSVRTVQKSSSVPGICEGNFMYLHDIAEIDFEILTSTIDQSSQCVPKGIWATTHPPEIEGSDPNLKPKSEIFQFTFDPRADFHEYRVDWSPDAARYYIDGVYQGQITEHVPQVAGAWLWNAWSNGDQCWSAGPPAADSSTLIRSIEIYKDFVPTTTGNVCPV